MLDHKQILDQIRETYDNFKCNSTLEKDIEEYNVHIDHCMLAFINIYFGKTLSGGYPSLVMTKKTIHVDGELVEVNPSAILIFTFLVVFATENGNPNFYIKE